VLHSKQMFVSETVVVLTFNILYGLYSKRFYCVQNKASFRLRSASKSLYYRSNKSMSIQTLHQMIQDTALNDFV